jgi:hypothetical protein
VLVGEAHGDAIAAEGPEFLDEPVVELAVPLPRQEGDDLGASVEELAAVSPMTVNAGLQLFQASSAARTF